MSISKQDKKEMKKCAKEAKKIIRREISKAEAMEMFKDDEYKLDLISDLEDQRISKTGLNEKTENDL
mgnify:CR=1 FL=1